MPDAKAAPKRSLSEWSFLYRRQHVLRAIRHPRLSPASKQVLVALSLRDDDPFVLPERPPIGTLARHLALAERTVRQALAELVEQGCLTFRATGEVFRPGEGEPVDPVARPDLVRERAFLRAASALPSRAEHLAMMARLRDRAVAARRIATAVSAERALGRALGIGVKRGRGTDAPPPVPGDDGTEATLAPPHPELATVDAVNVDRALAPAARHAAIELLLDPVDDPMDRPDDDDLYWSGRLAGRLGLTLRGARKALAELADLGLIAQARIRVSGKNRVMPGSEVCIYPGRIAERMRRGTDAPPLIPGEGLAPIEAHVRRLEALRDLAADAGLAPTAVTAQHAIGRALDFVEAMPTRAEVDAVEEGETPAAEPAPPRFDVLPFIRRLIDVDPEMGPVISDVLAELRGTPPAEHAIAQAAE